MALKVVPTKGNLISTKKQLQLAVLGYDLLDKKRNVLIKEMMSLLDDVKMVVLDEADEMLDMGFREDIELILNQTPIERQTTFFSATMSKEILELTKKYQDDPELIKIVRKELWVLIKFGIVITE